MHGLLLAAGAGTRMGQPKALVVDDRGAWVARAAEALQAGGCARVTVVLGAEAERARALVPAGAEVVMALDWAAGLAASLRAGLTAAIDGPDDVAMIHLVDLPDVGPDVIRRVAAAATGAQVLVRAAYRGRPGHPVLLGRSHWQPIIDEATGDQGAGAYLGRHAAALVECGDLASGCDVDRRREIEGQAGP